MADTDIVDAAPTTADPFAGMSFDVAGDSDPSDPDDADLRALAPLAAATPDAAPQPQPQPRPYPYVAPAWTQEDLDALKATVCKDLTVAEFRMFLVAAKRLGLDPWARQVVPIKDGGRVTVQTTIDGFRLIAERTKLYRGQLGPFWCGKDGQWHDVWLTAEAPLAARVGVLRAGWDQPMWGVARTEAYRKGSPTWRAMPDVMIAKVAESLAFRRAFPNELSGVYTEDELGAGLPAWEPEIAINRRAITERHPERHNQPQAHVAPVAPQRALPPPPATPPAPLAPLELTPVATPTVVDADADAPTGNRGELRSTETQRRAIQQLAATLGIDDYDAPPTYAEAAMAIRNLQDELKTRAGHVRRGAPTVREGAR